MFSTTVAFYNDPGYVNTASGSDANDLLQELQSTGAYTVNAFAGTSAASFSAGLSGANVLVIPALDEGDLGASLDSSAIGVIDQFVSGGGGLVITGDSTNHFGNFLNDVFSYDVTAEENPGTPYHLSGAATGTDFADSTPSLPGNTDATGLVITSLPAGSEDFYDAYYNVNATGVLMPYGSGEPVCFLGWDWANGGPGGTQDGGWNSVLDTAIAQVSGATSASQASATGLAATAQTLAVGQSYDFAVDVISASGSGPTPTGTVTFYESGVDKGNFNLTNGTLLESFTANTPGDTTFDAVYSGDANYTSSTSNTVAQTYLPASTAVGTVSHATVPVTGISGEPFAAKTTVELSNDGSTLQGDFLEQLFLDADGVGLSDDPTEIASKLVKTTFASGRKLAASFAARQLPASLTAGTYHVVAKITDPLGNVDLVTLDNTVSVAAPVVDLSASVRSVAPAVVPSGRSGAVRVTITNTGNIAAAGVMTLKLSPSPDALSANSSVVLSTMKAHVNLRPGKGGRYTLHFKVPASLTAGTYYPWVTVTLADVTASGVGSTSFTAG